MPPVKEAFFGLLGLALLTLLALPSIRHWIVFALCAARRSANATARKLGTNAIELNRVPMHKWDEQDLLGAVALAFAWGCLFFFLGAIHIVGVDTFRAFLAEFFQRGL